MKASQESLPESLPEPLEKYIRMTDDLLCQYQSRKAFLASAMKPEDYMGFPAELAKKYTRKIENARFLTAIVEDVLEEIQEIEHRAVIDLIYFQHKTSSQIAEELFCCTATVFCWKLKALKDMAINIFGVDALELEEI